MKQIVHKIQILFLLALMVLPLPATALAQTEAVCQNEVVVQADDWLSKIAAKFYGDPLAFQAIAEATNAKAASDSSYATIENVDLIEIGWKLCLPAKSGDMEMLDQNNSTSEAATEQPTSEATTEQPASEAATDQSASVVSITFLHLNDVYEITPVNGGAEGGLARVATLRKQLLAENPNTFTFLAGDLFSPSALGTAKVDGERLDGQQAVAVMNTVGLDFATFGNHEFDVKEEQFYKRLAESEFTWFSSNVFDANGEAFAGVSQNHILTITGDDSKEVKIGLFGVTLGSNPTDYVSYTDPFDEAATQIAELEGQVDILVALTHLAVNNDILLSEKFPQIDLILGGHEHENMQVQPGPDLAPIYKADANARTAYVHTLLYNTETGELQMEALLQPITPALADDPETLAVINEWLDKGFAGFKESGFNPEEIVTKVDIPLDGTEISVRNTSTDLTKIVGEGMLTAAPDTELSIYNGGLIRIDDILPPGAITEYDIIRVLPFGGKVMSVNMTGSLLSNVLDQGQANIGKGGYLQMGNVNIDSDNNWLINNELLDETRIYLVAINDFLLTGFEENLEYLNPDENPDITVVQEHEDIRRSTINQLKIDFPPQ